MNIHYKLIKYMPARRPENNQNKCQKYDKNRVFF